ncbi:MAG: endopeptidase La [Bacilli bacterium]|nr:endopeptidase La [Bacilli bacterium]
MLKTNLSVILLRGIVLLPHCELRIEINNDIEKKIIENAEKYNDGMILIVSPINPLEEVVSIKDLLNIATIGKVKLKIQLKDEVTRVVIEGINRVNVVEYINAENHTFEANIEPTTRFVINEKDETALIRKLVGEVEGLISKVPYMSNSILNEISNEKSIAKITDLVANYLPLAFERKLDFLKTVNPYTRVIMLIEDIKTEEEIISIDEKIESELKKQLEDSQKEFILREKIRIIKEELGDISVKDSDVEILRTKIEKLKCNKKVKDKLYNELKKYEMMNANSPEMGVVRNYIDWLLDLPWNVFSKEELDLNKARRTLDESHYGLDKVKTRIIEFLAVKQVTNNMKSPIICLVGPPGTGKTTLAMSIAKAINRNFVKISVGGINDEAEIIGHRRTYIGANPGRIISTMKKAKTSNPVFLIDEIDKMTKNYKGDPASAMLEILDKEQNKYFIDNYIEEEYDLSNVMFILTANNIYDIPEALRDRLEIIKLSGYTEYEKLDIAKKHTIFRELKEHRIKNGNIKFDDLGILTIIRHYTKEAGVRELERLIESIIRKIITERINNKNLDNVIINSKNVEKYLGKKIYMYSEKENNEEIGVATGLAYTESGGDILPIEATYYNGKGNLLLTGSLGDVMKESAQIALSYIKGHCSLYNIDYNLLQNSDIHIHVPEGAIPKDGPSAGITVTTAIISAFTNKCVNKNIAMTGEITLRGTVLPIGGLKEKAIGANRSKIKTIILPKKNERDLDEIPDEIKKNLKFKFVSNYEEVYKLIF